ncbi:LysR substrate-binding domain-containing protein [Rheinheimera texasensis]|uniref:LysR substrate-binding domain-containing protein n=1 Tax=Rheinheimera texasensis TaxID=306205 RepID=UPI00068929A8|nr:LysR substrate-binding domain-containing protein [Rheinheimera texasensis]
MQALPPLKALQAFEATARLHSFSAAAQELYVSQSAISHQVRLLEQQLGCVLINRKQQPLALTEQGATLFSVLQESFFRMRSVCQHLVQQPGRRLAIAAQTSIAVEFLAPRLNAFRSAFPHIETLLHMESNAASLDAGQFDLILGTWPCPSGFATVALRPEWWFPVCSPAQYQQLDLQDPASVFQVVLYSSEQGQDWQLWRQQMQLSAPATLQQRQVSLALLATKAVSSGEGIALSNSWIAGDAVRAGTLKALLQWRYQLPWGQYQLHYRPGGQQQQQINQFIQWFCTQMQHSDLLAADGSAPTPLIQP